MTDPECGNCGREWDEFDLSDGVCVCGFPMPSTVKSYLETKRLDMERKRNAARIEGKQ